MIKRLEEKGGELSFCYEAGPCGYGLYRQITRWGQVFTGDLKNTAFIKVGGDIYKRANFKIKTCWDVQVNHESRRYK